jgi:hypothetical protein
VLYPFTWDPEFQFPEPFVMASFKYRRDLKYW